MKVIGNFRSEGDKRNRRDFRNGRQGTSKQQPFQSFCFKRRRPRDEEETGVENLVRREDRQAAELGTREVSRLTCNCPPVGRNQRTEESYGTSQTVLQPTVPAAPNIVCSLPCRHGWHHQSLPPHCHRCRQNYNGITTLITTSFTAITTTPTTTTTTTAVTSSRSTIPPPTSPLPYPHPLPTPSPSPSLLPSRHHQFFSVIPAATTISPNHGLYRQAPS